MKRVLLIVVLTGRRSCALGVAAQHANDWPTVGNDPGGMKYSPLTQITPANVARLAKAWTYDTGAPASGYTITPIVINNVMYLPVQGSIIVALKADAGTELWKFDLKTIPGIGANPSAGGRGISYWPGTAAGRAAHRDRDDQRVPRAARREDRQADSGPAGSGQPRHRRDGEVRRHLLDQHAAGALQEPGDHRRPHRRTGPLRHSGRSARRSIC